MPVPEGVSYAQIRDHEERVLAPPRWGGALPLVAGVGFVALAVVGLVSMSGKEPAAEAATNLAAAEPTPTVPGLSPPMVHFQQVAANRALPPLPDAQGSRSFLADVAFSKVPGKAMTAGLYRLNAGPALHYTYTYEEFKYIVEGEFHLTDGTGQKLVARQGDLVHFPRGTNVTFETPSTGLGYFIGQRGADEAAVVVDATVRVAIASNPAMVLFPQLIANRIGQQPKLKNTDGSHSFLGDVAFSLVPGKEMTAGLYLDEAGPALHYTYTYEEFKYILEGEFHLTDGTGQKVVARKGDLMHFPKGSQIRFAAPELGFGLYCGQRKGGTA